MKPTRIYNDQDDLFKSRLSEQLNPRNPLLLLEKRIDWAWFEKEFDDLFEYGRGQPPKPIRLIVGLMMIQHMEGLSDEKVVEKWVENPYWQAFCGYDYLQWTCPIERSSLVRWRGKLGEKGMEKILAATIATAVKTEVVASKDLEKVITDTTVMEKNIKFPTDSCLLNTARKKLVKEAEKQGLVLRQSYARLGEVALRKVQGYAHAKQFKRMKKSQKKLKIYLGRVVRDIERKLSQEIEKEGFFAHLLEIAKRLLAQEKERQQSVQRT